MRTLTLTVSLFLAALGTSGAHAHALSIMLVRELAV